MPVNSPIVAFSTGALPVGKGLFQPTVEGEARILLLIEAFSRGSALLEGRTKLAKLDFFLRYPTYLDRALRVRGLVPPNDLQNNVPDVETKMVRYRFGPWDPAYFVILGRLIGKNLVVPVPFDRGIGFRATDLGREIAADLRREPAWVPSVERLTLLRRHLNLSGSYLKTFIYEHFPEVTQASWGETL